MRFLLLLLLAANTCAADWLLVGKVTHIVDGDTFDMTAQDGQEYRIRPASYDAPERGRHCADEATATLSRMLLGQDVEARCYKKHNSRTKERQVCRVFISGNDVSLGMIWLGMGSHYKKFQSEQTAEERAMYSHAEDEARQAGRCIWR